MSIITAIFQAIGQALTFIFPLSEIGHSAIFHDFASRYSANCSELTGLIHIGMAIGIIVASYKVFLRLIYEFVFTGKEIFTKTLDLKKTSNSRKFMYFTFIPYIFMLVYAIPLGNGSNVFSVLNSYSYDGNLISEGICFVLTASLLLIASLKLKKEEKGNNLSVLCAIVISVGAFFAIPVAGLSLSCVVISIAVLFNTNRKIAYRYFVSISAPILIVCGIVEIARCVTYVNIISGIIAVVLSGVLAFFASKLLLFVVKKNYLKYFSFYDYAIGAIALIAGIIEIAVK